MRYYLSENLYWLQSYQVKKKVLISEWVSFVTCGAYESFVSDDCYLLLYKRCFTKLLSQEADDSSSD